MKIIKNILVGILLIILFPFVIVSDAAYAAFERTIQYIDDVIRYYKSNKKEVKMKCIYCKTKISELDSGICDKCLSKINRRLFKINEILDEKEIGDNQ